jgi:hypothetical protein
MGALAARRRPPPSWPRRVSLAWRPRSLKLQAIAAVAVLSLVALRPWVVERGGAAVATRKARAGVNAWGPGAVAADDLVGVGESGVAPGALPGHDATSTTARSSRPSSAFDDLLSDLDLDGLNDLIALEELAGGAKVGAEAREPVVAATTTTPAAASAKHQPQPAAALAAGGAGASAAAAEAREPAVEPSDLDGVDLDALIATVMEELEAEEAAKARGQQVGAARPVAVAVVDPASDAPLAGGDPLQRLLLDDDEEDEYDDGWDEEDDDAWVEDLLRADDARAAAVAPVVVPAAAAASAQPVVVPAAAAAGAPPVVVPAAAAAGAPPVVVPAAAAVPPVVAAVPPIVAAAKPAAAGGALASTATATLSPSFTNPPVRVLLANRFYFGPPYTRSAPGCAYDGAPLACEFTEDESLLADVDAVA